MVKRIALNQVGYIADMPKTAVIVGAADVFEIVGAESGKTFFSGIPCDPVSDEASGDSVSLIDFSAFNLCGEYVIRAGRKKSCVFNISRSPYNKLKKGLLKGLYYSRCGTALDKRFAGDYAHGVCHSELAPLLERPSQKLDVSGGWHDSGSYGKYTVCTCTVLAHLLYAYKLFPNAFEDITGIPESGNGIPDILNECRVGLEWLLKMQARDGGVYHKVVSINPAEVCMPEDDEMEQYVFPRSHQAAACFCAVTSLASGIFAEFDEDFSARLNEASINAWIWIINNQGFEAAENPPSVAASTAGDFFDYNFDDDMFWAVCELYEATGDEAFHEKLMELCKQISATGFSNRDNGGFGALCYLFGKRPRDKYTEQLIKVQIRIKADNLYSLSQKNGFGTAKAPEDYILGSNMYTMTGAMLLIAAHILFDCSDYLIAAHEQLNYMLGKNPNGISFVTGFGESCVRHPHHRPSESDDIEEPVPGLVVCGPNKDFSDEVAQWNIPGNAAPAKCYCDIMHSYTTNEPSIYCASSMIFVTGYLCSVSGIQ